MDLKKEIPAFVGTIVKGRGELLRQKIGNTSDLTTIKHEQLKKDYDYAMSINTSENGWVNFLRKNEATVRYLMICNKSKPSVEQRLFYIILEINKTR
jgi:hypothetical protein